MTGREKLVAALSEQGTASTPIALCYPEIFLRDHWEQVSCEPWWRMHDPNPVMGVKIHGELLATTGEDRYRLRLGLPRAEVARFRFEADGDTVRRIDTINGSEEILQRPPPGGFVSGHDAMLDRELSITSREEIDRLMPMPPEETVEGLTADGRDEKLRLLREAFGETRMGWTQLSTPLDPLPFIWGFNNLMTGLADKPDLVRYSAERSLAIQLRRLTMWKAAGVELIFLQECSADQMSPAMYGSVFLPLLQELTRAIREAGLYSIHYYTGNPTDRLDLLMRTGADALSLEESKKDFVIDIMDVARMVDGRMALVGNLDAIGLLEHGSDDALRQEVARQLDAGRANGGRFIFGLGSPVTPGTPASRVRALADMVRDLAQ